MQAQLITLANYATTLKQSTQSRSGTPDGNVFFDSVNNKIEFITKQELAQIDLGSGLEDNPLDETLGMKLVAVYAFESQERGTDEELRKNDPVTEGNFKFAGAYNFISGNKPSTDADRNILRGSGWSEFNSNKEVDRIYFGNKGLSNIEVTSQPFYQISDVAEPALNDIVPSDFAKAGQFDESVQVFGTTGNTPSDSGAGDFDKRKFEAVSIRTFGKNFDRKTTVGDLGMDETGSFSVGFAVNESDHRTTGNYSLSDVYGASQIAPWDGMTLEELDTPQVEGGFNEADGNFTWVLNNTGGGSLSECVAFLDALAQTDDDINEHTTNVTHGKRIDVWYSYDAEGRIVTNSGADGNGLFIENIPTSDEQKVVFTDDAGDIKTRPFSVSVEATIGELAKADAKAWYHSFFLANYNTTNAVTVEDSSSVEVRGDASTANTSFKVIFAFDYDGDTVGGTAGTDKDAVFLVEGDGGVTKAKTIYTLTKSTTVAFACSPSVENNM